MIELSIREMINCEPVISKLNEQERNVKTAYKLARITRELQKEYQLFNQARDILIKKYGVTDESGNLKLTNNNYEIQKEKQNEFLKEYNELLNDNISLNVEKLTLEELENDQLSAQEINLILSLIKE